MNNKETNNLCPECKEPFLPLHEVIAEEMVEKIFPAIWQEDKQYLKRLSKKELAEEMFGLGASKALEGYFEFMDDLAKKEK